MESLMPPPPGFGGAQRRRRHRDSTVDSDAIFGDYVDDTPSSNTADLHPAATTWKQRDRTTQATADAQRRVEEDATFDPWGQEGQERANTAFEASRARLQEYDDKYKAKGQEIQEQFDALSTIESPDFAARVRTIREFTAGKTYGDSEAEEHIFFKELAINSALFEQWKKIFIDQDRTYLQEKSKRVLEALQQKVRDKKKKAAKTRNLHAVMYQHKASEAFANMQFHPVHGTNRKDIAGAIKSQNRLAAEGIRPEDMRTSEGDAFISGDDFVYAGFAETPHPFAGSHFYNTDTFTNKDGVVAPLETNASWSNGDDALDLRAGEYLLDEDDFGQDTDIAFFDIHYTRIGPKSGTGGPMETYLNNYFDYPTGKEIIRTYLEYIFDDPNEALAFLQSGGEALLTEFYRENPDDRHIYTPGISKQRQEEIIADMNELFHTLGIAPPGMPEIRIRDHATIIAELSDNDIEQLG